VVTDQDHATAPTVTAPAAPPAEPAPPKTLAEAVAGGDYREVLEAQAREIVTDLRGAAGAAKAALHTRLSAISKELEEIKVAGIGAGSVVADTADETWDPEAI